VTIPPDVMPYVLLIGGVLLIFVGYLWLQDELDMPNKGTWLIYDLVVAGKPFAFTLVGMMGLGAVLVYCGWTMLP